MKEESERCDEWEEAIGRINGQQKKVKHTPHIKKEGKENVFSRQRQVHGYSPFVGAFSLCQRDSSCLLLN